MRQVVIYLQQTNSELVQQTTFSLEDTFHRFQVIPLWEQPTDNFFQSPGLLPLAVLSQANNRTETLRQVAQQISQIKNQRTQSNIAASTFILAGLVLNKDIIQQLLRRELMEESVTYQALIAEGVEEGVRRVAINLLHEGVADEVVIKATGLSAEQIQQLKLTEVNSQEN
jgi:predicted transposase/invertase (TIGR01784 family)